MQDPYELLEEPIRQIGAPSTQTLKSLRSEDWTQGSAGELMFGQGVMTRLAAAPVKM